MTAFKGMEVVEARDMLQRLEGVKREVEGRKFRVHTGICRLATLSDYETPFFRDMISSWPHFSGSALYPVPSRKGTLGALDYTPIVAYTKAANSEAGLWDQSTEYGQLRWDLLNYCIDRLTRALEQVGEKP